MKPKLKPDDFRPAALPCATAGCPNDARIYRGTWHTRQAEGRTVRYQGAPWQNLCCECVDRVDRARLRLEAVFAH
jgi:hypothetical protein